jgi:hypothetical protein
LFKRLLYLLGLGKVIAKCGHETETKGKVEVIDEKGGRKIITIENIRNPDLCIKCLGKTIIRCAWCGGYILPTDSITLFTPSEDFNIPKYSVRWEKNPSYLIGCSRSECCTNEHDLAGWWVIPGKVQRIAAPISYNSDYPKNKDPRRLKSIED